MKSSKSSRNTSTIAPDEELLKEASHYVNNILEIKFVKIKEIRASSYLKSREEVVSTRKGIQQGVMDHLEVSRTVSDSLPQNLSTMMEIKSSLRDYEKNILNFNSLDGINKFIQQNEKELQDEVKQMFSYNL